MLEVFVDDAIRGRVILAFDGRVLELFIPSDGGVGRRHHVSTLQGRVEPPDRKGRTKVVLWVAGRERDSPIALFLEGPAWASIGPLLDALARAGVQFASA